MTEHTDTVGQKALFFKNKNQEVYIKLESGFFYRGSIKDLGSDFLILDDERLGEMPVFFSEVVTIEPREVKT